MVCTGNVCRSAVAERLAVMGLENRLGDAARHVEVRSAGVRALVGEPMDVRSAAALAELGGSAAGFTATQLEPGMLADADLVVVAGRRHRATAARMLPAAIGRTFTLRELARLVEEVDLSALPDGTPDERLRALVAEVAALRGRVPRAGSGEDDVEDPYGRPPEVHQRIALLVGSALEPVLDALAAAVEPAQVAAADDAREQRLLAAAVTEAELADARRRAALRRRARRILLLAAVLLPLAYAAVLGYHGYVVQRELDDARVAASRARAALLDGDAALAGRRVRDLRAHSEDARDAVSGPGWRFGEQIPFVGDDLSAVRTAAVVIDGIADDVLPPLVEVADSTDLARLRVAGDRLDLAPLVAAQPELELADGGMQRARRALASVDRGGLVAPVGSALGELSREVADLAGLTRDASALARVLPPLLGGDGTKRYFLAFQNNAEARGTGGLLGAFGILEATEGRLSITRLGSNQELEDAPEVPVDLGPAFAELYGDSPRLWVNANVSPHFPYAAQIWLALWERQFGEALDGVIATDPVGLGLLLRATGPVTGPDGRRITSRNAAEVTMKQVYERYPTVGDDPERDAYLQEVAGTVAERALSGRGDPRALVSSLREAVGDSRLKVYSADPEVQTDLAPQTVSGTVPEALRRYLTVTVNSGVASKLDYYLEREVTYTTTGCTATARRVTVRVDLTNAAPAQGLPPYVAFPPDERDLPALAGRPRGTNLLLVDVVPTIGTGLVEARLDGETYPATGGRVRGHPVFGFDVALEPGQTRTVEVDLVEPRVAGRLRVDRQPLVRPLTLTTRGTRC